MAGTVTISRTSITNHHLLLLGVFSLLFPLCTNAFTTYTRSFLTREANVCSRLELAALIYMPDGEVIHDEEGDQRVVREGSTAILEYLNAPDFRGPLAVLAAAHGNVDIATIQQVQTIDVTKSNIHIEAICAADETNCVNLRVNVDFPIVCQGESEIIQNLNALHKEAASILETKKLEKDQQKELNVRQVAPAEKQVPVERDVKLEEVKSKREAYKKQRALLAARLKREALIRALRKEDIASREAQARDVARETFKREMQAAANAKRKARLATEEEIRLAFEAKRQSHAKQRALLAERLQREARNRVLGGERGRRERPEVTQPAVMEEDVRYKPNTPLDDKKLAERYEAIADIGERAFTILVDLGMVVPSPNPDAPDYDSSKDDEYVR